ncbi:MAG: hypothetical protein LBD35_07480 [Prevotellaceae bacterium]|nr:hypothetical protein [Prevotellaceae bacterium]
MTEKITCFWGLLGVAGFLTLPLLFCGCNGKAAKTERPIAEVGYRKLHLSEIEDYIHGLSEHDSIMALNNYVNRWAKNQVVLRQAERNLSEKEKDLSDELDNYRTSLLIYKYEQKYLAEKMDTAVSQSEIEKFYRENPDNFKLTGLIVKALFLKVPNSFREIDKVRSLYRSNSEKALEELRGIALQGAEIYTSFGAQWMDFNDVCILLPGTADAYENRIIRMKYVEDSDEKYTYFLKANEISMKDEVAPLEHVKSGIRNIILNRRRTELLNRMENAIYNDAIEKNQVKINITKE